MVQQAFQTNSLSEAIIGFGQFLRTHHYNVGTEEVRYSLQMSQHLLLSRTSFLYALKGIFCTDPDQCKTFERLFSLYWDTNPIDMRTEKNQTKVVGNVQKSTNATLVMLGMKKGEEGETLDAKTVSGASDQAQLSHTDFSKVAEVDKEKLEKIAEEFFRELALRIKRRRQKQAPKGTIHIRKTIRRSLPYGGMCLDVAKKQKKPKKNRLIMFLDVSGSMDTYSFYLLKLMIILKQHFRQMECFLFSTSLLRITEVIDKLDLRQTIAELNQRATLWSNGTQIGECLQTFVEKYGSRTLNGSPIVLILSDGLDTSEPHLLSTQLKEIKDKARKVIWLNPLKGSTNYAPEARGMKEALPWIDGFTSAHNLNSLSELESILSSV